MRNKLVLDYLGKCRWRSRVVVGYHAKEEEEPEGKGEEQVKSGCIASANQSSLGITDVRN